MTKDNASANILAVTITGADISLSVACSGPALGSDTDFLKAFFVQRISDPAGLASLFAEREAKIEANRLRAQYERDLKSGTTTSTTTPNPAQSTTTSVVDRDALIVILDEIYDASETESARIINQWTDAYTEPHGPLGAAMGRMRVVRDLRRRLKL